MDPPGLHGTDRSWAGHRFGFVIEHGGRYWTGGLPPADW